MRCETCQGEGRVRWNWLLPNPQTFYKFPDTPRSQIRDCWVWHPCPECNGCGITHCCEGDQASPSSELTLQPHQSTISDPPPYSHDPIS